MKGEVKDIPVFQEEVCKKTCMLNGKCIEENKNNSWFFACPHYHSWKFGYTSFVWEQLRWEREHPEEVKIRQEKNKRVSEIMREKKRAEKAAEKKKASE